MYSDKIVRAFSMIPERRATPYYLGLLVLGLVVLTGPALYLLRNAPIAPPDQTATAVSTSRAATTTSELAGLPPAQALLPYIEVTKGCGIHYDGECVNVRSGPGTKFPVVEKLRNGIVLKIAGVVTNDAGEKWYKITFDEELRHPERITGDWYVKADTVDLLFNDGTHQYTKNVAGTTSKRIVVSKSEQMLYAYDGDTLFMQTPISTGLDGTPTPLGTFTVYKMTPSRYMQGPIEGQTDQYYDLPGVPWNLYFTKDGAVIHGAYWHNSFGHPYSHGCVNLPLDKAKELYLWADIGMTVTIKP